MLIQAGHYIYIYIELYIFRFHEMRGLGRLPLSPSRFTFMGNRGEGWINSGLLYFSPSQLFQVLPMAAKTAIQNVLASPRVLAMAAKTATQNCWLSCLER